MTFSEISKTLRKEKGLSQVQLAEALKVSNGCIAMIEIGKNEPTANTLLKYADFFQCSTDYLLGREDDFGNITIKTEKPADLSDDELKIVKQYRSLHAGYKALIENQIKFLVEQQEALEVPTFEHIKKQTNKRR
jgi:transcriptional regulator, XRE family